MYCAMLCDRRAGAAEVVLPPHRRDDARTLGVHADHRNAGGLRLTVCAGGGAGVERPAGNPVHALGHHRRDVGDLLVGRQVGVDGLGRPAEFLGTGLEPEHDVLLTRLRPDRVRVRDGRRARCPIPGRRPHHTRQWPTQPSTQRPSRTDSPLGFDAARSRRRAHPAAVPQSPQRDRRISSTPLTVPCQNEDTSASVSPF